MSNYLKTNYGRNDLENFSNDFFNNLFGYEKNYKNIMKTDVKENENGYQFEIEMPGFNKNNIKITLEKGYLTVEGESKTNEEEKKHHFIRRERHYGCVSRTYYVGDDYQEEDIKAAFNNGILTLTLPKEVSVKKEKKFITIE